MLGVLQWWLRFWCGFIPRKDGSLPVPDPGCLAPARTGTVNSTSTQRTIGRWRGALNSLRCLPFILMGYMKTAVGSRKLEQSFLPTTFSPSPRTAPPVASPAFRVSAPQRIFANLCVGVAELQIVFHHDEHAGRYELVDPASGGGIPATIVLVPVLVSPAIRHIPRYTTCGLDYYCRLWE